jgi:UPF0716 protein FxsA
MRIGLGLAFIAFPLIELALLIRTGQLIGVWPTLAIVAVTGAVGAMILHRQGSVMISRAMQAVEEGQPPVGPLLDGVFLVFAGALLVAPGLITDTVGLLLLIPPFRRLIGRWCLNILMASSDVHVKVFTRRRHRPGTGDAQSSDRSEGGPVIEGDYEKLDERTPGRASRGSRDPNPEG